MNLPKDDSPALHAASVSDDGYVISDERLAEIRNLLEPASEHSGWQVIPKGGVTVYDLAAAVEDLLAEREAYRG